MAKFEPNHPDFTSYGLSCVRWDPSPMRRPDHHNEIQLNMLVRGRVTYLIGAHRVKVKPGHLTAFWAAIPHQIIDYEPDTEYYVATLPLAWFLQCELPDLLVQPLVRGEVVSEPQAGRADFDTALFRQWEGDLRPGDKTVREIVFLEMKTRLRRLALALETQQSSLVLRGQAKLQVSGLNKVEQMVCFIAQSYMDPIKVTDIGRKVGLHPNSAMRLFKRVFGTTLIDHLTHHRIFHAKRLLTTTDQKIVDVAFSSGFSSISRFNEAFRRACGCTPRAYRLDHERDDEV
ncbi:MAG TPA: helix-turn-helix domain-containing protein [Opitutaceae bacterium]|jgi:AraC-like DNA-binding protein|nr:helix-turn-helix domain-containing protein [Opitutaceae bacterium]HRE05836.1 helix-turn-helix domain-containing protein [Opitutaceae bacterium]